jgi:pimeloyl-ACP methyl ester carboxylesterase
LHEGIPVSELVVLERSGHMPWLEEPDAFFGTIREWVERT